VNFLTLTHHHSHNNASGKFIVLAPSAYVIRIYSQEFAFVVGPTGITVIELPGFGIAMNPIYCILITSPTHSGDVIIIVFVQTSYVQSLVSPCFPYKLDSVDTHIQLAPDGVLLNTILVSHPVATYSS